MKMQPTLNAYIQQSIRENWNLIALDDLHGIAMQYSDVARRIAKLHIMFRAAGLKPGDRIALCGRNSAMWSVAILASLTYGTVAVPILHDFKPDNIHHLVTHSEARLFFVDQHTWENIDPESLPELEGIFDLADFSLLFSRSKTLTKARAHLNEYFGKAYPERFTPNDVTYESPSPNALAIINYTSGSMGFSKGVMISYNNLWSNIQFGIDRIHYLKPGDSMVCMLPLAHMYGLTFEMLHGFIKGMHIYFLTRTPSPRIIIEAFAVAKPKLVITVPLIIEKIIKTRVFPTLDKPLMKMLLHMPIIDNRVLAKVREKLIDVFGGNLQQLIIGGAALNGEVEKFLQRIRFPFTVGYGMTECAPLITYEPWDTARPGSCGRVVDRMEVRVDSDNPEDTPGVLYVRGDNVMKGYYKNKAETAAAISDDGWLNTGDIVNVDKDGYIYIRGRAKSMILGPSGQNIYPEEIELKINNLPLVNESLVVDDKSNRLIALIYPDLEEATRQGMSLEEVTKQMEDQVQALNAELPAYSRLSGVKIYQEEFQKTPKRSIKRYLYQHK